MTMQRANRIRRNGILDEMEFSVMLFEVMCRIVLLEAFMQALCEFPIENYSIIPNESILEMVSRNKWRTSRQKKIVFDGWSRHGTIDTSRRYLKKK